jgi:hypothetical protein
MNESGNDNNSDEHIPSLRTFNPIIYSDVREAKKRETSIPTPTPTPTPVDISTLKRQNIQRYIKWYDNIIRLQKK